MAFVGKRWVEKSKKDTASAVLYPITHNRKLAPIRLEKNTTKRLRPVAAGPFVSATYISLKATCPSACPFRDNGCYVTEGFYGPVAKTLDANAAKSSGFEVVQEEAWAIEQYARRLDKKSRAQPGIPQDGGKNGRAGRDLRLHVGGDAPDGLSAIRLGEAAEVWKRYGGGQVWTYTHSWRDIKRKLWGPSISVLASVESVSEIKDAMRAGYAAAIVLPAHNGPKAWYKAGYTFIPCPAETGGADGKRKITCVECRLCLDADKLHKRRAVIAFSAHGSGTNRVKGALEAKRVRRLTVLA